MDIDDSTIDNKEQLGESSTLHISSGALLHQWGSQNNLESFTSNSLPFAAPPGAPSGCVSSIIRLFDVYSPKESNEGACLLAVMDVLLKIVNNILHEPYSPKYRGINASSSLFQRMFAQEKGPIALDFLVSLGFELIGVGEAITEEPKSDGVSGDSTAAEAGAAGGKQRYELPLIPKDSADLGYSHEDQITALRSARELLQLSTSYVAKHWPSAASPASVSSAPSPLPIASTLGGFDPYKTHVYRTNPEVSSYSPTVPSYKLLSNLQFCSWSSWRNWRPLCLAAVELLRSIPLWRVE